jgi:hypothetical protein
MYHGPAFFSFFTMPYETTHPDEHEHQLKPGTEILFTRQRHEAERMGLHWDYRLVVGNLAYSWATKKPMPEPGKSIVLFEQPIHDKDYALSPKVVIPTGSYGAGVTYLDFVRKAKIGDNSTQKQMTIVTHDGEKYLLKHIPDTQWGEKAWLFRNLGTTGNKYLEKVSAKNNQKPSSASIAVEGIAGATIAKGAPQRLLGYHALYHGTSSDNAKIIKKEGFDPSHGGKNNIGKHQEWHYNSKDHVHFTKSKLYARSYSGNLDTHLHDTRKTGEILGRTLRDSVLKGKILKTQISDPHFKSFKTDEDQGTIFKSDKNRKNYASKTTDHIGSEHIAGGKGSKGILSFLNKTHLKDYYASKLNHSRIMRGAAMATTGGALLAHAGNRLLKKINDK